MPGALRDTTRDARAAQLAVWRRMGPEGRLRSALESSEAMRQVALDAIRQRHPEYDDATALRALVALLHGVEVARAMWPGAAPAAP